MNGFKKVIREGEFSRDLKQLLKKYRSLEQDLEVFVRAQLLVYHKLQLDNHGIFPLPGLGFDSPKIYKAKKFACKALKGRGAKSGIRVIYAYLPEVDEIHLLEIYCKSEKEGEDRERIKNYLLTISGTLRV